MRIINQKGFSGLDTVLAIALIAVIGVAGYFAYQNVQNHSSSSKSVPTTTPVAAKSSSAPLPTPTYFVVKELNAKFVIEGLPDIKYKFAKNSAGDDTAVLYTDSLAKYCNPDALDAPHGVLFRVNGQYSDYQQSGLPPGILLKQYDGYFISYREPQQPCTNDPAGIQLLITQSKSVVKMVKTLQPL